MRSAGRIARILLRLIAVLGPGAHGAASADNAAWSPDSWGGRIGVGYQTNVIGASQRELEAFRTGDDPDYFFVVEDMDDWLVTAKLWAEWRLPSFYKSLQLELGYGRSEWSQSPVLGRDHFAATLTQRLPGDSNVQLAVEYEPQVYLRHRPDDGAAFGEPRFRPEAFQGWAVELAYTHPFVAGSAITLLGLFESRNETQWFRHRDREQWGAGLDLGVPLTDWLELEPGYEYVDADAYNPPEIDSDRSFREHGASLRATAKGQALGQKWYFEAGGKMRFREYTTNDREDDSRYGRHDRPYYWNVKLQRRGGIIAPYLLFERGGRTIDLPSGADVSTEDGEYESELWQLGLEFEIK